MKNLQTFITYIGNTRSRQRRNIMLTATLSVIVLFVVSMLLTKPADSMSGQLICETLIHTHSQKCSQLVCTAEEHICDDNCTPQECTAVHICGEDCPPAECQSIHICDENCPPTDCPLVHVCDESCVIPECTEVHICDEGCTPPPCTPHQHNNECYELTCGLEEHEHSQECYEVTAPTLLGTYFGTGFQIMEDEPANDEAFTVKPETLPDLTGAINAKDFLISEGETITGLLSQGNTTELIADAKFQISFKLTAAENPAEFEKLQNTTNQLIYYELPDGMYFDPEKYGTECIVYDKSYEAAYYTLANIGGKSYAIFRITEEYRTNYLNNESQNAETFTCSIKFDVDVERAETDLGDRTIHLGPNDTYGAEITFPDFSPSISKSGKFVNTEDTNPYITWTVTINNPTYEVSFYEYLLTDDMLDEVIDGSLTVSPAGAFTEQKDAEGKITSLKMNDSTLDRDNYPITITYNVPAREYTYASGDYNVPNNVQLKKDGVDKTYQTTGYAWVNAAAQISKSVAADYKSTGKIGMEYYWTINVNTRFGLPIGDYTVFDEAFISGNSAQNIQVYDGETLLTSGTDYTIDTASGKLKFASTLNQKSLKITYSTKNAEVDKTTSNTAKVIYPNGNDGPSYTASASYQPYKIYKNGVYDKAKGLAKWTVEFQVNDFDGNAKYNINDIIFTDERLAQLADINEDGVVDKNDITVTGKSIYDIYENTDNIDFTLNNDNTITFSTKTEKTDDYDVTQYSHRPSGGAELVFYTKPMGTADDPSTELGSIKAGVKTIMPNQATIEFKNSDYSLTSPVANAVYDPERWIRKSLSAHEDKSISLDGVGAAEQTKLDWTIEIMMDLGFSGDDQILIDTMKALNENRTENSEAKHYIDKNDRTAIKVYARKGTSEDWGQPIDPSYYTIAYFKDTAATDPASDSDEAKSFTIKFNQSVDDAGFTNIKITYTSTTDISAVTDAQKISFVNEATFDSDPATPHDTFVVEVYDPNNKAYEKTAINADNVEISGASAILDIHDVIKDTINGTEYYIFGWKVNTYNVNQNIILTDELPEGHTLCTQNDGGELYKPKVKFHTHTALQQISQFTYNWEWLSPTNYVYDEENSIAYFSINPSYGDYFIYYTKVPVHDFNLLLYEKIENDDTSGISISNLISPTDSDILDRFGTTSAEVIITGVPDPEPVDMGDVIDKSYVPQKEANYNESTGAEVSIKDSSVSYSIDVNRDAADLANGDYLILTDSFLTQRLVSGGTTYYGSDLATALLDNLRIYEVGTDDSLTELPASEYSYQVYDGNTIFEPVNVIMESANSNNWTVSGLQTGDIVTIKLKNEDYKNSSPNGRLYYKAINADDQSIFVNDYSKYYYPYDENGICTYTFVMPNNCHKLYFEAQNLTIAADGATVTAVRNPSSAELNLTIPDSKHLKIEYKYNLLRDGVRLPNNSVLYFTNEAEITGYGTASDLSTNSISIDYGDAVAALTYLPTINKVDVSDYTIEGLDAKFKFARYDATNGWQWYSSTLDSTNKKISEDGWASNTDNVTTIQTVNGIFELDPLVQGTLYALVEVEEPQPENGYTYQKAKYVKPFYFSYGTTLTSFPTGIDDEQLSVDNVKTVQINSVINVPNSRMIDVTVIKEWDEPQQNATVTAELYWSYKRAISGFPSELYLADATELNSEGLVNSVTFAETYTWENLPNGHNGKPIYYYVKETAYTINGIKTNVGDGEFVPIYRGNGVNSSGSAIKITNASALSVKKVWCDINNTPLPDSFIPVEEIKIELYGAKTPNGSYTKITNGTEETFKVTKADGWKLKFTPAQLGDYQYFQIKEITTLSEFTSSQLENYEGQSGSITITNKLNREIPYTSIIIQKKWQDAGYAARPENISLTLMSTTDIDNARWEVVNISQPQKVTLDDNNWTYTYQNLLYETANGQPIYYKVIENNINGYSLTEINNSGVSTTPENNPILLINTKTLSVTMRKSWNDNYKTNHADDTVKVNVYKTTNADNIGSISGSELVYENIEISAAGNWEATVDKLPAYDVSGNLYYYWIYENLGVLDSAYSPSYLYNNDINVSSINLNDGEVEINNSYIYPPAMLPSTGSTGKTLYYVMGMIAIVIGCLLYIAHYNKHEKRKKEN